MDLTVHSQYDPLKEKPAMVLTKMVQIGLGPAPLPQSPLTPPRCPPRLSIVLKAVLSPPPVTSLLLPHRQLLSPSIFNAHYLEMNGHLQRLHRLRCYITANMGLEEQHE